MYLYRRGSHWWIRKAVPVDLVEILGIAQVRRSLRTRDAALARRRALQLLIRVDDVYAVLRSEQPLRPTREVALALLDAALSANMGAPHSFDRKADMIARARHAIMDFYPEGEDLSFDRPAGSRGDDATALVSPADALSLLYQERPRGPDNKAAVALLQVVDQMASIDLRSVVEGHRSVVAGIRTALAASEVPSDPASTTSIYRATIQDLRDELVQISSSIAELKAVSPPSSPDLSPFSPPV